MSTSPPGVRTAWLLGVAGLIPFFAAGVTLWAGPQRFGAAVFFYAPIVLLTYAATIASFLGGARWGTEIARAGVRPIFLVAAVAPQLAAVALVTAPLSLGYRYAGLAVVLLVQGIGDAVSPDLPPWYRSLRIPLTAGAVAAVAAGAVWALTVAASRG